jgi:hypothetical protein
MGSDLMNQINSGEMKFKQSEIASEVKAQVSEALTEIIQRGARARPLFINSARVGWVRPLAYSERKILDQFSQSADERFTLILSHCTTLTEKEIEDLDIHEFNSLLIHIHRMTLADLSLYPFLSAFITTQQSQALWVSRHDALFNRSELRLFDGSVFKFVAQPDIIPLWASLSSIREDAIKKLEQTQNFGTLIKAWAGKSADKYLNDISKALQSYQPDIIQPWVDVIDYVKLISKAEKHFDDGFGHSHEDNTVQGLLREMQGMLEGDKHELLMETFYQGQLEEAQRKNEEVQRIIQKRREDLAHLDDSSMVVLTDAEVRRRERQIREASVETRLQRRMRDELSDQPETDEVDSAERISKYFQP